MQIVKQRFTKPKKDYIGVRVEREVKMKLAKKANRERRSLASMCELLLIQGTATEILE